MDDIKNKLVTEFSGNLINKFDDVQIDVISDELVKVLKEYDVMKSERQIVVYEDTNQLILDRFCACMMISGRSKLTIGQYRRTIEKLFNSAQKKFMDIGVYDIRLFLAFEKQRGISNRTLENTRANISAFFQWLLKDGLIDKNPCMSIDPIKYPDKVRLPFSSVEIEALRKHCKNDKQSAIIEILLSTGMRVSELTNLKCEDIDFNSMSVHITHGKGDKERTVYINELAKVAILNYLKNRNINGEYLFYNNGGTQLNPGGVRLILNKLAKRAGVENVHPHRFRRTFASNLARRGMDIQDIRKLLGHTNLDTTMNYVYTSNEQVHISYLKFSA